MWGVQGAPHLKAIPGVGSVTGGRLTGGDVQHLGGHADGALHLEVLLLGASDQVSRHCGRGGGMRSEWRDLA